MQNQHEAAFGLCGLDQGFDVVLEQYLNVNSIYYYLYDWYAPSPGMCVKYSHAAVEGACLHISTSKHKHVTPILHAAWLSHAHTILQYASMPFCIDPDGQLWRLCPDLEVCMVGGLQIAIRQSAARTKPCKVY